MSYQPKSDKEAALEIAWHDLRRELEELHAKLEYMLLMLKINQRKD